MWLFYAAMAAGLFRDRELTGVFVVSVVTAPICILATALRFIAAGRRQPKSTLEDWCALGGLIVYLVYVVISLYTVDFIDGRLLLTLLPEEVLYIGKLSYATAPLFAVNQGLVKFSILFLYYRLFHVNQHFVRWIYIIGGLHIAYCLTVIPIYLFSCQPVSKGWDISEPGTCIDSRATVAALQSVNSGVDFALVILALFMIRPLNMKMSTKWKLGLIFALGSFAGVIGFVKIAEAYTSNGAGDFVIRTWSIAQMASSIICCCAPTYKPILPSDGFFDRIASQARSYSSWFLSPRSLRSKPPRPLMTESSKESAGMGVDYAKGRRSQEWLYFDGSSQRGLAWTEVNSSPDGRLVPESSYALRTVTIQQSEQMI
ncbi:hypothetical protein GGR54DRAFT_184289 [Hypoxylon sp. NC1633]|nr:hypothetical protein GGR54DRAFT_184289 [Hypoxylon sp. NC1633]